MSDYVGRPLRRFEDARFVTGQGEYSADIDLPGQAHAVVLRSPHAHAEIVGIETEQARALPGVLAVYTCGALEAAGVQELASLSRTPPFRVENADGSEMAEGSQYALARERVRYVGEPVALIVAETLAQAVEAAEAVEVDYRELDAVVGIDAALAPGAPLLWPDWGSNRSGFWEEGDSVAAEAALAAAAHRVEATVAFPRISVSFMEPRAALASYDPADDRYLLQTGGQSAHRLRDALATILNIAPEKLRVVVPDTGGGFGARNNPYPEFVSLLFATRALGRPVKWVGDRSESFAADTQARSQRFSATLGLDPEGRFLGLAVKAQWRHGGYLAPRSPFILRNWMAPMVSGAYKIPAVHFAFESIFTNSTPMAAYRGIARAEVLYLIERLVEAAALQTGLDRIELRRRNMIAPEEMPWPTATGAHYAPAELERCLDLALDAAAWSGFPARRTETESRGRLRGLGVAPYIMNAGGIPDETAKVEVTDDGKVAVQMGTQDFGMGHATVFAQVVADALSVAIESVQVRDGDSDAVDNGGGAHGSRAMRIGGGALLQAVEAVIEQGRQVAEDLLEAAVADIAFEAGSFVVKGTDRGVGLAEVAQAAAARGRPMLASETFHTDGPSFPNGCHLCEVEVDPETGAVAVVRLVTVADPGRVVNPLIVEGQVHGGLVQGIGEALLEEVIYDPESGQLLTGSMMDYCLPRADDLPMIETRLHPVLSNDNPLGVKGVGESGTVGAPAALVNAVLDALKDRGVTDIDMPVTPERVWRALQAAQGS